MNPKSYSGHDIVVTYDLKRCIHAAECVGGLPRVFDSQRRPWVDPDAADADTVAEVVERCPSGALHYMFNESNRGESPSPINSVSVRPNGPLHLRGTIAIVAPDGETILSDTRVALCRCGSSANKPFCDGSHSTVGFQDAGNVAVAEVLPDALDHPVESGGILTVTPRTNGSYLFSGLFEIRSHDGAIVRNETKKSLCRCGASSNKPFCDGTHKTIGFTA